VRRRNARIATIILTLTSVTLLSSPASVAHHRAGPCDFHRKDRESVQHFSRRHIKCAIRWFGPVPGDLQRAICIARRESGLIPTAESETGKYVGLYQHARKLWAARYKKYTEAAWELPTRAKDGRTNAVVTIRMVVDGRGWLAAGWKVGACR
jgi:hypothetical protein